MNRLKYSGNTVQSHKYIVLIANRPKRLKGQTILVTVSHKWKGGAFCLASQLSVSSYPAFCTFELIVPRYHVAADALSFCSYWRVG